MSEGLKVATSKDQSGLWLIPQVSLAQAVLILAVASQLLFVIGLQYPGQPFFDETHYVPAARDLITGTAYRNVEHPIFAKFLIGLGIAFLGDNPFGWRILGTLMGTVTVVAVALITHSIFKNVRISLVAGLLTMLNQLVFIQARIAMLDVYMGAFVLLAIYFFIDSFERDARPEVRNRLIASSIFFGLAVGCKWAAAPYLAAAFIGFYVIRDRVARRDGVPEEEALSTREVPAWRGVSTMEGLAILAGLSALTYLATFIPAFFVEENRLRIMDLLPQQLEIYRRQTQPLSPHPYMSSWTQWPLIGRPIWYLYERVDGVLRGVLLVGNPAIMWGGLVAVLLVLRRGWRSKDLRLLLVAGLFFFSYGFWIVSPRNLSFYYYYYLPAIFLSIALAVALDRFCARGRARLVPPAFAALTLILFIYFYPIISAAPLQQDGDFMRWMWFDSWR